MSTEKNRLYPGCGDDLTTAYDLTTDNSAYDLSTATSGSLVFYFADDREPVEVSATLGPIPPAVAITATGIRLTRVHQTPDIPEGTEGTARVEARLVLPAFTNPIRGEARPVPVIREGT